MYNKVVNSQEASKWQKAIGEEITASIDNNTFNLVMPPEDRQIVWEGGNAKETYSNRVLKVLDRMKNKIIQEQIWL